MLATAAVLLADGDSSVDAGPALGLGLIALVVAGVIVVVVRLVRRRQQPGGIRRSLRPIGDAATAVPLYLASSTLEPVDGPAVVDAGVEPDDDAEPTADTGPAWSPGPAPDADGSPEDAPGC